MANCPRRLISYNGAPAGYTADPQENIVYVSAHDNQTLFDAIQAKAPAEASLADRVRMNNLALSIVMFSQGVPFFHAGDDILRSKSFDPNSYNSGDWYNKLDWTYESNNWGVGLPLEGTGQWDIYKPLLAEPALAPTKTDIELRLGRLPRVPADPQELQIVPPRNRRAGQEHGFLPITTDPNRSPA
jgi:pullulanase